jgi:hypothetical protein
MRLFRHFHSKRLAWNVHHQSCFVFLLCMGRRTMGTKSTINKQGTITVRCGAKASVIRHAVSIRSTQIAKRTNRAIECGALCIHSPSGFSRANQFQTVYAPSCAGERDGNQGSAPNTKGERRVVTSRISANEGLDRDSGNGIMGNWPSQPSGSGNLPKTRLFRQYKR